MRDIAAVDIRVGKPPTVTSIALLDDARRALAEVTGLGVVQAYLVVARQSHVRPGRGAGDRHLLATLAAGWRDWAP